MEILGVIIGVLVGWLVVGGLTAWGLSRWFKWLKEKDRCT
jgi:hypothetical protein